MYTPSHLKLVNNATKGISVLAAEEINKGDLVCELFFDSITHFSSKTTSVQVWDNAFLSNKLGTIDNYFNHSCDPNMGLILPRAVFVALRDINKGEELVWNYLTTEYDLLARDEDFDCGCGCKRCFGRIQGFRYLTLPQQQALYPYLSSYLKTRVC